MPIRLRWGGPLPLTLLAAALTACGVAATPTPSPTPEPIAITGTFTLFDPGAIENEKPDPLQPTTACVGTGGYSDIQSGLGVVVRNEEGTTIGSGQLTQDGIARGEVGDENQCSFIFSIEVPEAEFYTVEVGDRGELTYSRDELEGMDWHVEATLGD